jgi:hypothetical protein
MRKKYIRLIIILPPIHITVLLDAKMDVSTTKICLDTSILASSNMNQREYIYMHAFYSHSLNS